MYEVGKNLPTGSVLTYRKSIYDFYQIYNQTNIKLGMVITWVSSIALIKNVRVIVTCLEGSIFNSAKILAIY